MCSTQLYSLQNPRINTNNDRLLLLNLLHIDAFVFAKLVIKLNCPRKVHESIFTPNNTACNCPRLYVSTNNRSPMATLWLWIIWFFPSIIISDNIWSTLNRQQLIFENGINFRNLVQVLNIRHFLVKYAERTRVCIYIRSNLRASQSLSTWYLLWQLIAIIYIYCIVSAITALSL